MKNYLKFIVAIVGVTVASFGTISKANAKVRENVCCKGAGDCGYTSDCTPISGSEGPC